MVVERSEMVSIIFLHCLAVEEEEEVCLAVWSRVSGGGGSARGWGGGVRRCLFSM